MAENEDDTTSRESVATRLAGLLSDAIPDEAAPAETAEASEASVAETEEPDEAPDTEADEDADPSDPEPLYEVKVNGEVKHVALRDLLTGYSGQAAITQKFQELSAEKKRAQSELDAVVKERQDYAGRLKALDDALTTLEGPTPDWDTLRKERPEEFPAVFAEYQLAKSQREQVQKVRAEAESKVREDQQRALMAEVERNRDALREAVPEWKNPEQEAKGLTQIVQYAKSVGFTDADLANVYDHRVILALREGMLYRQAQAKAKAPPAPANGQPTPRIIRPGAAKPTTNKSDKELKDLRKNMKAGDRTAGAEYFARIMGEK